MKKQGSRKLERVGVIIQPREGIRAVAEAIGGGCAAGITAAVSASGFVLAAETLWNGW
ncbi:MAG: hypothetical protein NT048_03290 [Flavobacterium sp.]|nr:hypothetical protein [Flavobacterium sp.]